MENKENRYNLSEELITDCLDQYLGKTTMQMVDEYVSEKVGIMRCRWLKILAFG